MENNSFNKECIKEQFEDCELVVRAKAIKALIAERITRNNYTRDEVKDKYYQLGKARNISDGKEVTFYHGVFGKMYRKGGLFAQVVPVLNKLFENSLLAYSETDDRTGTARADGTIHKERRNVKSYDNYVAKAAIDEKEYYVRFTVMNESDGKRGLHSSMVTNVVLYDETANVASASTTTGGRLDIDGIVDAKLKQFFESARESEVKFSNTLQQFGQKD